MKAARSAEGEFPVMAAKKKTRAIPARKERFLCLPRRRVSTEARKLMWSPDTATMWERPVRWKAA